LDSTILQLLLPEGLIDYFELEKVEKSSDSIHLYLSEKNIHPIEFAGQKLISRGFSDEIEIRDFPLRGKPCFLNLKRRKWLNETTEQIVFRDWQMVAKGTRMTKEFAFFFESLFRQSSD
jgi:hypothetical protein